MTMLGSLDETDPKALLFGDLGKPIEEHGLAGAAEPDHEDALARSSGHRPAERDAEPVDEVVATGQGGGRCAGAGAVGV